MGEEWGGESSCLPELGDRKGVWFTTALQVTVLSPLPWNPHWGSQRYSGHKVAKEGLEPRASTALGTKKVMIVHWLADRTHVSWFLVRSISGAKQLPCVRARACAPAPAQTPGMEGALSASSRRFRPQAVVLPSWDSTCVCSWGGHNPTPTGPGNLC